MTQPLPNYLRTYRKRAGFTQNELALLLDLHDGREVSAYERALRTPNGRIMVGCHIIFGKSADAVFPGVYREVEQLLAKRAGTLSHALRDHGTHASYPPKIDLLSALVAVRAARYHKQHEPLTQKGPPRHGRLS